MSWLASIGVAVLTGVLGFFVAGAVMTQHARWHRFSSMEGTTAFAILVVSAGGALAGLVIGLVAARLISEGASFAFLKGLGLATGSVLVIGALVAGVSLVFADRTPPGKRAAAARPSFEELRADSPVADWLPWTGLGASRRQREAARTQIAAHPDLADQMRILMVSDDAETAKAALVLVPHMPQPSLIGPVTDAGEDLAARIRLANGLAWESDDATRAVEDVSHRFAAWVGAVRALRESCDADLIPELLTILELSRVRSESAEMRLNVLRIASRHAHEWADVLPLPSDPE